jgi:hypothetical protein
MPFDKDSSLKLILDDSYRDYADYRDKGWFESDYYDPTRLGVLKKAAGSLFDSFARHRTRNRESQSALVLQSSNRFMPSGAII